VAHWLLAHEAGDVPRADVDATAADRVHAQLRTGLVVFLGSTGFESLWARAEHLAPPAVPPMRAAVIPPDARDVDMDHAAVLTSFITLLFTFVGTALGVRLLRQSWPALPLDAADLNTSDDTV
jgi:hypothetical protein